MKYKTINTILFLTTLVFIASCDKPDCKNTNPVFSEFKADTEQYKRELTKQVQSIGVKNLSYWFENYQQKDGKEFIIVNIQGNGLCATGELQVNEWGKLQGIRKTKGVGYRGAELKGLNIQIEQDSTGTNLIFKGVDWIVD